MPALIIGLVVLVLLAIGGVVRLLIAELAKPATTQGKAKQKAPVRRPVKAPAGAVGVSVGAAAAGATPAPTALLEPAVVQPAVAQEVAAPAPVRAPERPTTGTRARPAVPHHRPRRARMRDVVERGDGVRITGGRRARSLLSLVVLVGMLGAGTAALIGAAIVFIGFAVEQAIN